MMASPRPERLEVLERLARELRDGIVALQSQDVEQFEAILRAQEHTIGVLRNSNRQSLRPVPAEKEAVLKITYLNSVYRKLLQHVQARLTIAVALKNSGKSSFNQAQPQSCDFIV
jgi:hypothetical protein